MPRTAWSPKRERQYQHVYASCIKKAERRGNGCEPCAIKRESRCAKIAAALVNKERARAGESATIGRHCPRGTRPLSDSKTLCYDPHARRRVRRLPL
jgi:hypothetical protein